MTTLNNTHTKYKTKLLLTIIIALCFIFGGCLYILKQSNVTNNKDTIVELTPDFIKAIQKYDELDVFNEGYAAVCKDGKWGFINIKGEEIIQCIYSKVNPFHEGYAAVCNDEKWGYVNTDGKEIVQCIYSEASPFSEGYAVVVKDDKCGFVNTKGEEITQFQYSGASYFGEKCAMVRKDGKWGFINKDGEEIVQCQYSQILPYINGYAEARKDDKSGFVNAEGNEIVPCQYSEVSSFSEGYAAVRKDFEWGYINTKGEEIVPCQYSHASSFNEGYAAVCKDDKDEWGFVEKWGFVNTKGEEIVPCQYSDVSPFSEGFAAVCKDKKWGYVDTNGKEAIPINIEAKFVGNFSEGLAFVYKEDGNSFSVIDTIGNTVFSGYVDFSWTFEEVDKSEMPRYFRGKLYVPMGEFKSIVYDKQGNKIKETYDYACDNKYFTDKNSDKEYFIFQKGNGDNENYKYLTVGLKNKDGKELTPAIYAYINGYNAGHNIKVSNGVVLVTLCEVGEDVEWNANETHFTPIEGKLYYGYADLNGNDTFSEELKKKCKESYEQRVNEFYQKDLEEKQRLRAEGPDWLQGAWRMQLTDDYGRHLGYMYEVFNHGTSKTYANGSLISERNYTVSDDMVIYENNGYYQLDNDRQIVISADGLKMQKVSNDTSYSPTSYSSSRSYSDNGNSNNRQEREYMLKLSKLSDKGRELVNELSSMRANGNIDPFRVMYIKQNLIRYKDEQIDIAANKLHDSQLAREYMEQKRKLLLAFKQMGI